MALSLALQPLGQGDSVALEELLQGFTVFLPLGLHRLTLLPHAVLEGLQVSGGGDALLLALQDRLPRLHPLQSQAAPGGEELLFLGRRELGAALLAAGLVSRDADCWDQPLGLGLSLGHGRAAGQAGERQSAAEGEQRQGRPRVAAAGAWVCQRGRHGEGRR